MHGSLKRRSAPRSTHLTHPLGVQAFAHRRVTNDERDTGA